MTAKKDNWAAYLTLWNRGVAPSRGLIGEFFREMDLPESRTVLDVGCGTGHLATIWRSSGAKIFGVDLNHQATVLTHAKHIPALVADGFRLPFADGQFDLVYSDGLLEHFQNPLPLMREMLRVTGGILLSFLPRACAYDTIRHWITRPPQEYNRSAQEWASYYRELEAQEIHVLPFRFGLLAIWIEKGLNFKKGGVNFKPLEAKYRTPIRWLI